MTDVANLALGVNSTEVVQGTAALGGLTNAAAVAATAASGLSTSMQNTGAAATAAASGVSATSNALDAQAASARNAATALQAQAAAAARSTSATRNLNSNVGNLTAQFQDIGVTAAMGMNPLIIALQQGTQIAQVFAASGGGIGTVFAALRSLISPISLIVIGLVAASAAAIQYFMNSYSGAEQSEAQLQKEASLISRVTKEWGDALPALKAYNDEKERVKNEGELKQVVDLKAAEDLQRVNDQFKEFIANNQELTAAMEMAYDGTGRSTEALSVFAGEWLSLTQKIQDGTAKAEDFKAAADALGPAVAANQEELGAFAAGFQALTTQILSALGALQAFRGDANAILSGSQAAIDQQTKIQGLTTDSLGSRPMFRLPANLPTPTERPNIEMEGLPKLPGGGGGGSAASAYADATRSLQERTDELVAQNAAQAALNPLVNDYGYAMAKAKESANLLNAAEKDKKAITPELTASINAQAEAYAQATVEQQKLAEATKAAQANLEFVKGTTLGFITTLRQGLVEGEGFWKSFGNAALGVLDKIATKIETDLVNALFGGTGGGFNILSLFGLGGGVAAGGLTGGGGGVGGIGGGAAAAAASKVAAVAAAGARVGRAAGPSVNGPVKLDINMAADGTWKAHVNNKARASAIEVTTTAIPKMLDSAQKTYRDNQQHADMDAHASNPRRRIIRG